ncbi:transcriptional regulator [Nocardia pseudobrasiliensis]|uniref:DNA-binding MarR family transcriptional regulator n=1 Tax=Nocardia pseudobrasiliensis TaxID=45979 RepID=A0A370ICH9_9NOCA|nr:transcriptional regulator [Nocardia pseudobrasiliensis]RDI68435.1 DNA-binding MarR family transcriptional regulator [Nocardia pseudobrasiliensis]
MSPALDPALHSTTRLMLASYLSGCDSAEFQAVQQYCGLSPSNLSKHATALSELGYVQIDKGYVGKRPRTWLSLTATGRNALHDHVAALQQIAAAAATAGQRTP